MNKPAEPTDEIKELADEHVEWLLDYTAVIIKLVGKAEFIHGYKHGVEDTK